MRYNEDNSRRICLFSRVARIYFPEAKGATNDYWENLTVKGESHVSGPGHNVIAYAYAHT
jgi:hypothetical protein